MATVRMLRYPVYLEMDVLTADVCGQIQTADRNRTAPGSCDSEGRNFNIRVETNVEIAISLSEGGNKVASYIARTSNLCFIC